MVDPRSLRFSATVSTIVLGLVVILGLPAGVPLLIFQTLVFGLAAICGLKYQIYGWVFRQFIRPRLRQPRDLEPTAPVRFAQALGLTFTLLGLIAGIGGWTIVFYVAVTGAYAAALLNAAFNVCLGCELFVIVKRLTWGLRSSHPAKTT